MGPRSGGGTRRGEGKEGPGDWGQSKAYYPKKGRIELPECTKKTALEIDNFSAASVLGEKEREIGHMSVANEK